MKKLLLGLLPLCLLSISTTSCASSDVIRIGMECNYAPFNWTEHSSNEFTLPIANKADKFADGYDVQIAKHLQEQLGKPVQIYAIDWDSLISDLQLGSIDMVIAGMTDTEERRQAISFTDEYYRSELVLVTSKAVSDQYNAPLTSEQLDTLIKNQIIVSQTSTVTNDVIENIFVPTYGAIHASPLTSFALAAYDVSTGAAFAMTAEMPVANSIVAQYNNLGIVRIEQEILGDALSSLGVSIGIRKEDNELRNQVNNALSLLTIDMRNTIMSKATERSNG